MSDVTWLPVPGAAHYEVSSDGQVRSVERLVTYKDGRKPRHWPSVELRDAGHPQGYRSITITADTGRRTFRVHQLVCEAFHGPAPTPVHEVRHLNGIKHDNRAENLKWGTRSENSYDNVQHGGNKWANRTRCTQGHSYDEANTRWTATGRNGSLRRHCRECAKDWSLKYKAKPEVAARSREYQRRYKARKRAEARGEQLDVDLEEAS